MVVISSVSHVLLKASSCFPFQKVVLKRLKSHISLFQPSMVQGKTEKGYYVPLSDLAAPEISIILEYVFPLICLFFLMQDGWLMECLTWPFSFHAEKNSRNTLRHSGASLDWLTLRKTVKKQICSSKKVSQMKAILLLQTVSISKILDVETDNVATAGSSEMRRGGKEKFLRGKKTL